MTAYDIFNAIEGIIWWGVAGHLAFRVRSDDSRKVRAARVAALVFVLFGATDYMELGRGGRLPLWLWGLKIACGAAIFACRYEWRGWQTIRWSDREVVFGIACLVGVLLIIAGQHAGLW